jgi:hypothetical protein
MEMTMRRIATIGTVLALAVALGTAPRLLTMARGQSPSPGSTAYGKTLTEWMQLDETWLLAGGPDHVGKMTFLPLPGGDYAGGNFIYGDPGVLVGHLDDITLAPGTPFVLPVIVWYGETYEPALGYPDDPPLPESLFTDPSRALIQVYIDGEPVMDSALARVSPFYFGPAPISVTYPQPTAYGSIAAIFVQGVGFVHHPLSVGTHTIELVSELQIPPDPSILNLSVYPQGLGVIYQNSWTITVSPE